MHDYKIINGNLLNTDADYIAHQVNCQGRMGSGVAKAIRERHMKVYNEYIQELMAYKANDKSILGHSQLVSIGDEYGYRGVINMFAQDKYGYDGKQYTSLEAFRSCLQEINKIAKGCSIAFPWKIGCVRGGADWDTVLNMIRTELTNVSSITFYEL